MSRHPALAQVRLGCVKYLNSQPLIYGCDAPVRFDHPSGLARDLRAGILDVALVPVYEALQHPGWRVVDGVAVASAGPVFSVFLAHRGPLAEVQTIALDAASLTSAHLLRVMLAEFHHLRPTFQAANGSDGLAMLLIGNQAIDFRTSARAQGYELMDLGAEWQRRTGLPFVFAVWLLRPEAPEGVAEELRAIKQGGCAHLAEIAAADTTYGSELSYRYLTEHIRFELGAAEKQGLREFQRLLAKHGLLPGRIDHDEAAALNLRFV